MKACFVFSLYTNFRLNLGFTWLETKIFATYLWLRKHVAHKSYSLLSRAIANSGAGSSGEIGSGIRLERRTKVINTLPHG